MEGKVINFYILRNEPIYSFNQVPIIQDHFLEYLSLSKQFILNGGKRQNEVLLLV